MKSKRMCPHCENRPLPIARIGGNVVAVMHCPCNEEFVLFFRNQVIPLKRSILEQGSFDERKEHLGAIAASIFEMGMQEGDSASLEDMFAGLSLPTLEAEPGAGPITPDEIEKFVRIDLKCLDNGAYFRRHFGA